MIVFSNGHLHDEEEPALALADSGFLHGRGVFTTLRLRRGQPMDLAGHYQRLRDHGRQLELMLPLTETGMAEIIHDLSAVNSLVEQDARLRITLTRDNRGPSLSLVPGPLPPGLARWQAAGIPVSVLGPAFRRTILPALKTTNYLPSLLALAEAEKLGCPEALIMDRDDNLLEGAVSNVFLLLQGVLATPPDDGRILAGLIRRLVLGLAMEMGLDVREEHIGRGVLARAEEVFLTNSVRQIVPVVAIDGRPVGQGRPGPRTRDLQRALGEALPSENP